MGSAMGLVLAVVWKKWEMATVRRGRAWQGIDLPVFHSRGRCFVILPSASVLYFSSTEGHFQSFFGLASFSHLTEKQPHGFALAFFP